MSIKSILDALPSEQRKRLMHAFENQFTQHVQLDDNKFIGVHVPSGSNLAIEEIAGCWSYGTIKKG